MKLVFLGPPGAGKGTQAKIISQKLNLVHISTGEIFRENLSNKTELGIKAADYSNKGLLVPDDVTNAMVKDRLQKEDCKSGYILDGYPRTIDQAKFFESIVILDLVVNFEIDEEEVIERISGRRTCSNCGAVYHVSYNPPIKQGVCNNCSNELVQREDQKPDVVKNRLMVYNKQTQPLVEFYQKKGLLVNINAKQDINSITLKVIEKLENIK